MVWSRPDNPQIGATKKETDDMRRGFTLIERLVVIAIM